MKRQLSSLLVVLVMSSASAFAAESSSVASDTSSAAPADKNGSQKKKMAKKAPHKKVVVHAPGHVVVKPVVVHKRRVIVAPAPVYVHPIRRVPVRERVVVERAYNRRSEDSMLGIGVRLSGTAVDGQKLNLASVEDPTMWGLGLQFRGKVSKHLGLELAADWLSGDAGEMFQTTVPIMLSLMYYFTPDSPLKLYAMGGAGVHLTALEYDNGFRHDFVEVGGQVGGGLELRLSPDFALNADLRFLGLYRDVGTTTVIHDRCLEEVNSGNSFCSGINYLDTDDKFNVGAQFLIGASLYF